jgi:hypothetical protein
MKTLYFPINQHTDEHTIGIIRISLYSFSHDLAQRYVTVDVSLYIWAVPRIITPLSSPDLETRIFSPEKSYLPCMVLPLFDLILLDLSDLIFNDLAESPI